ncbi:MAG TPA: hypothetical protein VKY34_08045 [Xanthomarina sp.]|nr:hypothetical protein [Xanthomarina sp.]
MEANNMLEYLKKVITNIPTDWLRLTTHRLDIYNESLAKTQFLEAFETLYQQNNADTAALETLPTAYDYIRLGHPLSSVLEWSIAKWHQIKPSQVIVFSSQTMAVMAILRKNLFENKNTQIVYTSELPQGFDADIIKNVYGYTFQLTKVVNETAIPAFNGSTIYISQQPSLETVQLPEHVDFHISLHKNLGSILIANGKHNEHYVSEIQHVRRRETVAMTPADCLVALKALISHAPVERENYLEKADKTRVLNTINNITATNSKALVASSGLSIQYAILMGLIHDAMENHPGKAIKIMVPPNCYGGTNDQARRVAACLDQVDIVDLLVDGENNMVDSIDTVLATIAKEDAIPYIIAEIPTNPRVEVPDLNKLRDVLSQERQTATGTLAIAPVFILDQTFCPNVPFLAEDGILSKVKTISFASGSKFPSGGLCTAGYCIGNQPAKALMEKIEKHLLLCDNEATALQYEILAKQLPTMLERIADAYKNTRDFVNFIQEVLPEAKINFVSEALAEQGFTPSVFSLDLPTKGDTVEEKETYKRALNLKLINLMITEIPHESKFCVSYGQLKGCYWTIPATSTQGTTKEDDKDYIIRASLSPNLDLELHKKVFLKFVESM